MSAPLVDLTAASGAVVDGEYRYLLWRRLAWTSWVSNEEARWLVWVMLNPSTADAFVDDPTIRKCLGFARRDQADFLGVMVVNLFAFRATYPRDLVNASSRRLDAVNGPRNEAFTDFAFSRAARLIFAWGAAPGGRGFAWAHDRAVAMAKVAAERAGLQPYCFGRTKSGEPRHPLMLAYDTPLEVFA